ncbi:hypothetical protein DPMN_064586 [Dreissena polymorpha]|uniref:Uncharacterized protein n=1 Tax=Dreissena polymorpha TaxID=45954 RepID=A0A9D4CCH0_DREPO|nr:hypothetical protein DPMN_064586 [Dreissena polymorpha]
MSPPVSASGTLTAYPPGYTGKTATQSQSGGSGGSPTLSPPVGTYDNPTAYPPGYTSKTPIPCTSQWSSWINKDKTDTGDGDREVGYHGNGIVIIKCRVYLYTNKLFIKNYLCFRRLTF